MVYGIQDSRTVMVYHYGYNEHIRCYNHPGTAILCACLFQSVFMNASCVQVLYMLIIIVVYYVSIQYY